MKRVTNKNNGFTLLETLVAIGIIMIAVGSAFGLIPDGLSGARFAKNQVTANYLAMEAMETITNIRDNNMIYNPDPDNPDNWLTNLEVCVGASNECVVNTLENTVTYCSGACPAVRSIAVSGEAEVYGNGGLFDIDPDSLESIFTRTVNIQKVNNSRAINDEGLPNGRNDVEVFVTVTVSWTDRRIDRKVVLEKTMFDWLAFNK